MGKTKQPKRCIHVNVSHVVPGWGCCKCNVYNGYQRDACRNCGHVPCYEPNEASKRMCAAATAANMGAVDATDLVASMSTAQFEEYLRKRASDLKMLAGAMADVADGIDFGDLIIAMMIIVVAMTKNDRSEQKRLIALVLNKSADVISQPS